MTNKPKAIGTTFERMTRDWLRERLDDDRIDRRALHGNHDMGDLYGIHAHGAEGIVECKAHRTVTPAIVEGWQRQTETERGNADADFALLVIKTPNVGAKHFGRTRCRCTLRSLLTMSGMTWLPNEAFEREADLWVESDLETACSLIEGSFGEQA